MALIGTSKPADLGRLGKLPSELWYMIYDEVLLNLILRVYRDHDNEHIFAELLAAPTLVLVCRDTWYYCLGKYSRIPFTPIWEGNPWYPRGNARITDTQLTWYNPSIDTLFVDIMMCAIGMKRRDLSVDSYAGSAAVGQGQGQDLVEWEVLDKEWFGNMVQGLEPIFQCTQSILIASQGDNFLHVAMRPGLFPQLKKILVAAGIEFYGPNDFWMEEVASSTLVNRGKCPGKPERSVKCEPVSDSTRAYCRKEKKAVPVQHNDKIPNRWNATFSGFSRLGFPDRLPIHRALLERQMAMACHYWDVAYTTEEDGSRDYKEGYSLWGFKICPDSSEVVAFLHSLPDVEPVYLYVTKASLHGSAIRCF
ncbi:hypothetical protein PG996_009911 [Apiospora saccharicola]|uniref:Uncharacterized protein n=1 Tax=Apiospora saccharicola TaxID=335842 RepID=A0ABR1UM48_9PEZI